MGYFTTSEANALAATTVYVATLVDFQFEGDPVYVWNGFGQRAFGGQAYLGCGDLGSIEGLEETRNAVSQQVTFTLSAVEDSPSDILAKALDSADVVQGNLVIVSQQLFTADFEAHGDPIAIWFGLMQPPRVAREAATDEQGARRTMSLGAENLFHSRSRPAAGRYTDREQQQRYPNDLFCNFAPQLVSKVITWPDYLWLFLVGSIVSIGCV